MTVISAFCEKICGHCSCKKDAILLLLRLVLGIIFFQAGLGKLMNLETTSLFFAQLGIPLPMINALIASLLEFLGGIMLIVGFKTRLASLPLAFVMVVAILTAKLGGVASFSDFIRLQELDYIFFFLILASVGGGKYSLDEKCGSQCCKP